MADRLNIFELLENIDNRNIEYYRNLSPTDKKQFIPFVVMQWLACTNDQGQIQLLNELVNKRIFTLHKHPELLYYLMTLCTSGSKRFYKWKKPPQRQIKFPKSVQVVKESLEYSTMVAIDSMKVLSNEDILGFASDLGYQSDQMKDLIKELKTR